MARLSSKICLQKWLKDEASNALLEYAVKEDYRFPLEEGLSLAENMIAHVIDVGANYWSLWNFHAISAKNLLSYYQAFPKSFDQINRRIGYRVRPSMIWRYDDGGYLGVIVALANDGIAGVPGVLRVTVESEDGKILTSGCLDPGYPLPGKLRQVQFVLLKETRFAGLKLRAGLEVKVCITQSNGPVGRSLTKMVH